MIVGDKDIGTKIMTFLIRIILLYPQSDRGQCLQVIIECLGDIALASWFSVIDQYINHHHEIFWKRSPCVGKKKVPAECCLVRRFLVDLLPSSVRIPPPPQKKMDIPKIIYLLFEYTIFPSN